MSDYNKQDLAFSEIAECAEAAVALLSDVLQEIPHDRTTGATHIVAIEALLEKIGIIADNHCEEPTKAGVDKWLLPPAYHWDQTDQPGGES